MKQMVEVSICYGTLCFVMGGSAFETMGEKLPDDLKNKVSIQGMNCPGYCNSQEYGRPPFVKVNNRLIAEANLNKVIESIRKEVEHGTNQ
ncbi:MAG: hypothetical protein PHX54_05450 [Lentimicrobiaceae bacterium]|nr:hypothetical protein [Lentimicrobiaceae bacterium]